MKKQYDKPNCTWYSFNQDVVVMSTHILGDGDLGVYDDFE